MTKTANLPHIFFQRQTTPLHLRAKTWQTQPLIYLSKGIQGLKAKGRTFHKTNKIRIWVEQTKLRSSIGRRNFTRTRLNIYHSFVQIFDLLV